MKKINIWVFAVIFVLSLVGSLKVALATTPVFQTEEEIDAYYDAQKLQNKEDFEQTVKELNEQLQINLDKNHEYFDAKRWESYKESYGENFELFKPFFPESKTDPEVLAKEFLGYSRNSALNAIEIVKIINPDLANKVIPIYNREYEKYQKIATEIEKINEQYFGDASYNEYCVSKYGSGSAWDGVKNKDGTFWCECLSGYVVGENKKCISASTKISVEKPTTDNVIKNEESAKDNVVEKEIIKPEPVKKVPWYKKFINWLF